MKYRFEPPEHTTALHLLPDFHALFDIVKEDHESQLEFPPAAFLVGCDPATCHELIEECVDGLDESQVTEIPDFVPPTNKKLDWLRPLLARTSKERRESPFAHFREPPRAGKRF